MNLSRLTFVSVSLLVLAQASAQQPPIDLKNFAVDCRPLHGNTQRGIGKVRQNISGFTLVLTDAAHRYYNAPGKPGLKYWVVAGDVAQLNPTSKPVAAIATNRQKVQLYGALRANNIYRLFITYRAGEKDNASARSVIKASRCMPYVEPGIIPNELRHERPKPLAAR